MRLYGGSSTDLKDYRSGGSRRLPTAGVPRLRAAERCSSIYATVTTGSTSRPCRDHLRHHMVGRGMSSTPRRKSAGYRRRRGGCAADVGSHSAALDGVSCRSGWSTGWGDSPVVGLSTLVGTSDDAALQRSRIFTALVGNFAGALSPAAADLAERKCVRQGAAVEPTTGITQKVRAGCLTACGRSASP